MIKGIGDTHTHTFKVSSVMNYMQVEILNLSGD